MKKVKPPTDTHDFKFGPLRSEVEHARYLTASAPVQAQFTQSVAIACRKSHGEVKMPHS